MFKLIFYLGLTAVGVIGTFFNPLIGAVACLEAYLLNPNTLAMDSGDIRYQLITTVAFLASWAIYRPEPLPRVGKEGRLLGWLWMFVAIALASCFWAVYSTNQALEQWYELFKTVVWLPFLIRVIRSERAMAAVVMACMLGVWHASFLHVFGTRWGYVDVWRSREYGVLEQGQTAVLIVFIPLFLLLAVKGRRWERIVAILALPFVLDSLISTYQRMGFVVLLAEGAMLLLLLPRRVVLVLLPVLVLGGALVVYRLTPENWWAWMSTVENPTQESSADSRYAINDASRRMLMDYPLGVGYRNYLNVSHEYLAGRWLDNGVRSAHNSYFAVACEIGIPGFIAWICAFGGAAWQLRRIRKRAHPRHPGRIELYAMGCEIGLYGWFIGGLFHDLSTINPAFWLVAFTVVLARLQKRGGETPEDEPEAEPAADAQPA